MVEDEDLELFSDLVNIYCPKSKQDFFKCECNHFSFEHNKLGCKQRDCDCSKFKGIYKLSIPRYEIKNHKFWKAQEELTKLRIQQERKKKMITIKDKEGNEHELSEYFVLERTITTFVGIFDKDKFNRITTNKVTYSMPDGKGAEAEITEEIYKQLREEIKNGREEVK